MPSCCSRITAAVKLATRYTTPDTTVEIGTTSPTTVELTNLRHVMYAVLSKRIMTTLHSLLFHYQCASADVMSYSVAMDHILCISAMKSPKTSISVLWTTVHSVSSARQQCWNWPKRTGGGSAAEMFKILPRDWNLKPIFHSKMSVCGHELGGLNPQPSRQFQPCAIACA